MPSEQGRAFRDHHQLLARRRAFLSIDAIILLQNLSPASTPRLIYPTIVAKVRSSCKRSPVAKGPSMRAVGASVMHLVVGAGCFSSILDMTFPRLSGR